MKINTLVKSSGLLALVLTVAVGCAGAPEQPAATGPTKEEAQAAIAAAKDAYKKAEGADYAWTTTAGLIKNAEKAEAAGDYAKAVKLADEARRQAENALAQKQEQMDRLKADMVSSGQHMPMAGSDQYKVVRGDCLWTISAKDSVYGNPYEWPLIYKTNQSKIKDADLIYPGQEFSIDRSASSADIAAAVRHAKTRGKWSLGVVEESDKAYLAGK